MLKLSNPILLWNPCTLLPWILDFVHPITLGIDQPTIVLTIIPYNGIQYSGGTEGGTALKLAVKVPNLLMSNVAEGSFGFIPKVLKNEFQAESDILDRLTSI